MLKPPISLSDSMPTIFTLAFLFVTLSFYELLSEYNLYKVQKTPYLAVILLLKLNKFKSIYGD